MMESDWYSSLYTGDDDYVQSYHNYGNSNADEENETILEQEQEQEQWEDEEIFPTKRKFVEDYLPLQDLLEICSNTSTNTSNQQFKRGKRKKQSKRKKSPLEIFYEIILSWKVHHLLQDQRILLNLPSLVRQGNYFKTIQEYCDLQKQLPIEESRVSILHGIKSPKEVFSAIYCGNTNSNDILQGYGTLQSLLFEIQNSYDFMKPGCVYFAFPQNEFSTNTRNVNKSKKCKLNQQLADDIDISHGNCLVLSLALGRCSVSPRTVNEVAVWVHTTLLQPFLQRSKYFPTHWKFYFIENIITYQRMYVACHDIPKLNFMNSFIGQKQATHVTFHDCEDLTEDDSNNQNSQNISLLEPLPCDNYSEVLNTSQMNTLKKIYGAVTNPNLNSFQSSNFLHLIQGPPGCGKTHFLVHLLETFIRWNEVNISLKSLTILVCAPSNKAICVIMEKYLAKLLPNSWRNNPIVLVGVQEKLETCSTPLDSEELLQDTVENTLPGYDTKDIPRLICSELIEILGMTCSSQNSSYPNGLVPLSLLRLISTILAPTSPTDCLIYSYCQRLGTIFHAISLCYVECLKKIENLAANQTIQRSLTLSVMDGLTNEYYDLIEVIQTTTPNFYHRNLKNLHLQIINTLRQLSQQVDRFEHTPYESILNCFSALVDIFASYSNDYCADLLDHASIICSTLSSSGNSLMKSCHNPNHTIDVLIVDEAGQCLESELLIPFYTNPLHLVLIGDPKQLPATVLSQHAQKLHLGNSSLYRLMYECHFPYDILNVQYRMHPDICLFPNKQFYNNQLQTPIQLHQRHELSKSLFCEKSHPLEHFGNYVWINVSGHEMSSGRSGSSSRANSLEASVVVRLIQYFSQHTSTPLHQHLGIITFYSAQVKLIKQYLHKSNISSSSKYHVMSVDGFQGSEKDIIIVSFVRCNPRSEVGFVKDFQRLNVSLTRAKYLLILVGCLQTMENSQSIDLQNLVQDVKLRNCVYPLERFNEICK